MRLKKLLFVAIPAIITILLIIVSLIPDVNEYIETYQERNQDLSYLFLAIYNVLGIVVPPIPSLSVNFVAVKYIEWYYLVLLITAAELVGYSIAFYLARISHNMVFHLFPAMHKFDNYKKRINGNTSISEFTFLQFCSKPVGDYMSVFSGVVGLKYTKYLVATAVSSVIYNSILFYLFNLGWELDSRILIGLLIVAFVAIFMKKVL